VYSSSSESYDDSEYQNLTEACTLHTMTSVQNTNYSGNVDIDSSGELNSLLDLVKTDEPRKVSVKGRYNMLIFNS